MQKKKIYISFSIIGIIILVLVVLKIVRTISEASKRPVAIPSVVVSNAKRGEIIRSESLTGDILPIQQASVYPKVTGNIEKIYVDIGDKVGKGQLLALIDTTIYSQNAKQARANYIQASANLENSKLSYDRNKSLFAQNLVAKQDLDNAKTAYDVSLAQKEAAFANYNNALIQLSYCRVTAPFSGYITKRFLDPGAYVSPTNPSGAILFTLMDVSLLKSIINIPEKDVPDVSKILEIRVTADALPNIVYKATIKKISEAVDLSTRTMAVEVDINNFNNQLKPGMFATITLVMEKKDNVLILPNQVVLNNDTGNFIFVVNPDNTVHRRYIKVGIQQDNKDEILSGITEQDKIVFVGQSLIKDNMKVKPTE
ncbi:MAG: efflux RND transporter periplasmic adaptor subunit [Ignavibacteriaceae bacterium]